MKDKARQTENRAGHERRGRQRLVHGGALLAVSAALAALFAAQPNAAENPIKIALIADKTGPLEAYAKQTSAGFAMGLDYATGGTMMVEGHKLAHRHREGQPDQARRRPQPVERSL